MSNLVLSFIGRISRLALYALLVLGAATSQAQNVIGSVPVGGYPQAIAVNPITNRIYVANQADNTVSVIDGVTNAVTTVAVGSSPQAVAVNARTNRIYVANYGGNTVTAIDGATNATFGIAVGVNPFAIAVNSLTDTIYVAHGTGVTVISGATTSTTAVPLGHSVLGIAVNPVTNKVYATLDSGSLAIIDGATLGTTVLSIGGLGPMAVAVNTVTNTVYVADAAWGVVFVIDGGAASVTGTIPSGSTAYGLAVNSNVNRIYVTDIDGGVTIVDGTTLSTQVVAPSAHPVSMALDAETDRVYATNYSGSTVTVVDGATATATTVTVSSGPNALAVNPVTHRAYVTNINFNVVHVIDGASNAAATIGVGNGAIAVDVNPSLNRAVVANFNDSTVSVVDGATSTVIGTVPTGFAPFWVASNPATGQTYVANFSSNSVTVVDQYLNTATVTAGGSPVHVAVNPATNRAYVSNSSGNTVTVINGATLATSTVTVGANPNFAAVNTVTNRVYVANMGDGTVTVIDGVTHETTSIVAGSGPGAVAVNETTNRIYVANSYSSTITVIDGATNGVIGTVGTGSMPTAIAVNPLTNRVYVSNTLGNDVLVINGATNTAVLAIPLGAYTYGLAVNTASNKVYVATSSGGYVIDGGTNVARSVAGSNPYGVAVNAATGRAYFANQSSADITIVTENPVVAPNPLTTVVTPLEGNVTASETATLTLTAAGAADVFVQMDDVRGAWTAASPAGSDHTFTTGTLSPGVHILYAYAVDGSEASGCSSWFGACSPPIGSIAAYVFTYVPPLTVPDAPTIGTVTPGNGQVSVAFEPPANWGGSMIQYYTATCGDQSVSEAQSPIVVTGLTNGVAVTCTVVATNEVGDSVASSASASVTPGTIPDAPTIGTPVPGDGSISVYFTPGADGGGTVSAFTATCGAQTGTASSSPVVVSGLANGSSYYCTVYATNAFGDGPSSDYTGPVTPGTVPTAPSIAYVTAGDASVSVTYNMPSSDGGVGIDSYTATCGSKSETGLSNPLTVTGLTNGVEVTCTVRASNSFGDGPSSEASSGVTPYGLPAAPSITAVTPGNGYVSVEFTAGSDGGSAVTSFTATCGSASQADFGSPIMVSGLENGVAVTCTVYATNAAGNGPASAPSSSVTPVTVPDIPTIGTATRGDGSVSVAFTPGSNGGSAITGFTAYCGPFGVNATGTASPIVVTGLDNGYEVTCRVLATNAVGSSELSAESNAVTPAGVPGQPVITAVNPGDGTLSVDFQTAADNGSPVLGYKATCGSKLASGAGSPIVVSGLTNGVEVACTVVAYNAIGYGSDSDVAYGTPGRVPDAPTIGVAVAGDASVSVAFAAPGNNGGASIGYYLATCGSAISAGGTSPILVSGLPNGVPVNCSVIANNAFGDSPASASSNTVTPVAPGTSVISIGNASVLEGNSGTKTLLFPVTRTSGTAAMTFSFATQDATAAAPGDYNAASGTGSIAAGGTGTTTISITVKGDTVYELDETFLVVLSNPTGGAIGNDTGVGTITNNDNAPTLKIANANLSPEGTSDGGSGLTFTITRTGLTEVPVTFSYSTSDVTATAGFDYDSISGSGSIAPGGSTGTTTLEVVVRGDSMDENNETFHVDLADVTNATVLTGTGTGTITDDDAAPTVSISDVTITEGDSGTKLATFSVALSAPSGKVITMKYVTQDGTATAASGDYQALPPTTLTFNPNGSLDEDITVVVNGDTLNEDDDTFRVVLSAVSGTPMNATFDDNSGLGTIVNDDLPPPSLSISDATITEGDSGTSLANFTVTLSAVSGRTVTVRASTMSGTAKSTTDFTGPATTLTFAPGVTTQTYAVAIVGDLLNEATESFTATLSAPVGATLSDASGVATIIDNDEMPSVSINDVSAIEGNSGVQTYTFTVTLSAPSGRTVAVSASTSSDTATSPSDFTMKGPLTLTFQPGQVSKTFAVTVKGDTLAEPTESFNVILSGEVNATIDRDTGIGTIINDDGTAAIAQPLVDRGASTPAPLAVWRRDGE